MKIPKKNFLNTVLQFFSVSNRKSHLIYVYTGTCNCLRKHAYSLCMYIFKYLKMKVKTYGMSLCAKTSRALSA